METTYAAQFSHECYTVSSESENLGRGNDILTFDEKGARGKLVGNK